jgi:hypothetical protein
VWEEVSNVLLKLLAGLCVVISAIMGYFLTLQGLFVLLQLCFDLTSSLNRLLDVSDDDFWRTGWVHIRVQHQMAFIFNGILLSFYCGFCYLS